MSFTSFVSMTDALWALPKEIFLLFLILAGGYGPVMIVFFLQKYRLVQEKKQMLMAFSLLETCDQEWFYVRFDAGRGIASENLEVFLRWPKPLKTLEDLCQAITACFSQDISSDILRAKTTKENVLVNVCHPETKQACEISMVWQRWENPQKNSLPQGLMIWFRNTTQATEDLETLLQEKKAMKEVLNVLPFPIWTRDQQGHMTYCNRFYKEALGSSLQEQPIEKNSFLWLDQRGEDKTMLHTKERFDLKEPLKRHIIIQNERCFYQFKEEPATTFQGTIGYGLDLTEAEKITRDLEQHTLAYQEVLENLSEGITVYGADKRLKFFNHAYAHLFESDEQWLSTGPSLGEVLDDAHRRRFLSEQADYTSFREQQIEMVSSLLSPFHQLEHLPDGRTMRRIAAPHPLGGILFIFEDLTSSLVLERKYNAQTAVHQTSLEHLYEGTAIFGSDNQLKLLNPAFVQIWSPKLADVQLGHHISTFFNKLQSLLVFDGPWETYRDHLISNVTDRTAKNFIALCPNHQKINFRYVPLPDGSHLLICLDEHKRSH